MKIKPDIQKLIDMPLNELRVTAFRVKSGRILSVAEIDYLHSQLSNVDAEKKEYILKRANLINANRGAAFKSSNLDLKKTPKKDKYLAAIFTKFLT